jgi:uncharacterized protein YdhG (YjbR/CyaY superfamily)
MTKTDYPSVDAYIAAQPEASRPVLETVRTAIRSALPEAQEVISYQIPAYRVGGRVALFFAGWKKHYSLYPASEALVAAFAEEIGDLQVAKGTIRFPLLEPVPTDLIRQLATFRASEVTAAARQPSRRRAGPS